MNIDDNAGSAWPDHATQKAPAPEPGRDRRLISDPGASAYGGNRAAAQLKVLDWFSGYTVLRRELSSALCPES